jgi:hypothetical protein
MLIYVINHFHVLYACIPDAYLCRQFEEALLCSRLKGGSIRTLDKETEAELMDKKLKLLYNPDTRNQILTYISLVWEDDEVPAYDDV